MPRRAFYYFWAYQKLTMKKIIFAFLLFATALHAQQVNELYSKSLKGFKHGDYPLFLEYAAKLDSVRPWHPVFTYNLARAYALNNKPNQAFSVLQKSVLMDGGTAFETDTNFISLRELPEYRKLSVLKAELDKAVTTSRKIVTLSEKPLHPEGLLYLKTQKKWFAGSIRQGKIVTFDIKSGKCTDWLDTDYSVFALKADAEEKYIWVATSAMAEMEGFRPEMADKGEILKVNIKTGKIEERFSVGGKHNYGDLAIAKNGIVYVSDSYNPTIYKIESGSMTPWFTINGGFNNFQGLCFNADESKLYLADYFNGIAEIPIADPGKRRWFVFPEGTIQKGIDGIAFYDSSIIAIHNGVKPIRIIRYFLDGSDKIAKYQVIDNNRPEFSEPTIPYIVNGKCYFFANCPWPAYDKKKQLDDSKYQNPMLYNFDIKTD